MSDLIKVVGVDLICFPAHAGTLEPLRTGCYDPWAWTDPEEGYVETVGVDEWNLRYTSSTSGAE